MNKTAVVGVAVLLLSAGVLSLVTAASIYRRSSQVARAGSLGSRPDEAYQPDETEWLTEYTLTERSGREFHSRELDGNVHVVNFFFASCPSVCRLQSGKVAELQREFGPQEVVFLSLTCDPETDTPENLRQYADLFNAHPDQWLFLTGDLTYLRRVGAEMYQLPVDKQVHSESLVVVDRWGKMRGRFHWNKPKEFEEMKSLLASLLAETEPTPARPGPMPSLPGC